MPDAVPDAALLDPDYPVLTDRLALRPFEPGDLDALHDLFADPDVCRYLNWPPMDRAAAAALLERRTRQFVIRGEGDAVGLAVVERETGTVVGEAILQLVNQEHRQGEIGWAFRTAFQGRGYATEAATAMLRLGFEGLGLHRIIAEADPRNDASIRLMERIGMRHEGMHVDVMYVKDEWVGSIVYAMLDREWRLRTG